MTDEKDSPAVLDEVQAERQRQDEKWGGPEHDSEHEMDEWLNLLNARRGLALHARYHGDSADYRRRLIQIAALAVAAVEAFDRAIALAEQGK
jgi:hypothetical protein